jgi:predicted nucleic acid-binding Zn ribbon protein
MSRPGAPGGPRRLGSAFDRLIAEQAPATLLAEVQTVWPEVCGPQIAARAEPVAERDGKVTIACESGAWAQELELMGDLLRERIDAAIGADRVTALRFTADLARHR